MMYFISHTLFLVVDRIICLKVFKSNNCNYLYKCFVYNILLSIKTTKLDFPEICVTPSSFLVYLVSSYLLFVIYQKITTFYA